MKRRKIIVVPNQVGKCANCGKTSEIDCFGVCYDCGHGEAIDEIRKQNPGSSLPTGAQMAQIIKARTL